MAARKKRAKGLRKAILTAAAIFGGTTTGACARPVICDPAPPPTTARTPTPSMTPMICDPMPPPSVTVAPQGTPTSVATQRFAVVSYEVSSDPNLEGAAVQGMVYNMQGEGIAGLTVWAEAGAVRLEATTDARGAFDLRLPQPGSYFLTLANDRSSGLVLDLKLHDLAEVVWAELEPEVPTSLPMAEIRTVKITHLDGLSFGAESPWPKGHCRWSVSGGALERAGTNVTWQPPAEPGRYLLQVVADWGPAGLAVDAWTLTVGTDGSVAIG